MIITKNEAQHIRRCLESVEWAKEIVIVDAFSTDETIAIGRDFTDKIFQNHFQDFSSQKNFALSKCRYNWVLSLDADEVLSPELKEKIKSLDPDGLSGYRIRRQTYIFGRLFKYGGHAHDMPLRLFDKSKEAYFYQPIHESLKISGAIGFIEEPILHYSSSNLDEYMRKLNLYTELDAKFLLEKKVRFSYFKMICKPIAKFFQRYIVQRGYLDGYEGLIFYLMSGFDEFIKWSKYWQYIKRGQL